MHGNELAIGIVGAGTAGLATAIALARAGHRVEVFEKHPSLATLGAGLLIQPQGVEAIAQLGLADPFHAASVPVDRLFGTTHRNWKLVDVRYRTHPARAVSRAALASLLHDEAIKSGVGLRFGANVTGIETAGAQGLAHIDGARHAFDLLVIADGAASVLPAQAGLAVRSTPYKWGALWGMFDVANWDGARILQQRFHGTHRMFGLMPTAQVGDKLRLSLFWSLPKDAYDGWKAAPLEPWKHELLRLWPAAEPVVAQIDTHARLTFASYHHARARCLARPPICIVGDAAHAMSPQLGLGATLAVQDALSLATAVQALGPVAGPLAYSRQRLRTVHAYQALSRLLTPCFQAHGNGWWRDCLFAASHYIPGVPQLMARGVAEPIRRAR